MLSLPKAEPVAFSIEVKVIVPFELVGRPRAQIDRGGNGGVYIADRVAAGAAVNFGRADVVADIEQDDESSSMHNTTYC